MYIIHSVLSNFISCILYFWLVILRKASAHFCFYIIDGFWLVSQKQESELEGKGIFWSLSVPFTSVSHYLAAGLYNGVYLILDPHAIAFRLALHTPIVLRMLCLVIRTETFDL